VNEDIRDARVDDLRRQLRTLGYLDAGVDRFVLGSARSARHPVTIAALGSIRVGLLAGVLLGPAAAVGIASRLPGLVTGSRDAAVVALYLGAIFGLALTAFTFIVSTLVARAVGRAGIPRARWISRGAGSLVTVSCLIYLTFWWRSASAGFAWAAPVWTLSALAVAVTISLLLGHAVAITTFAVMAARGGADAGGTVQIRQPDEVARSTWRLVVAAGVLAFGGAATLLILTAPGASSPQVRPPLAVVSPGLRVRLVAIDGFDPEVFESLRAAGRVPALAELLANGRARFSPDDLRDPARAWTTVATGQPPEVHGVHGLETRRVAGLQGALASGGQEGATRTLRGTTDLLRLTRPSIASGAELRAKPFWEVAADAGLRSAVVNWWATWPAPEADIQTPVVISDRAVLRLERGGALDAEIAPKELYDKLRAEWPAIKEEAARAAGASILASSDAGTAAALRRSAELDALQLGLSRRVLADRPDVLAVYLPGLDVAQHVLLAHVGGSSASAISARVEAVRGYYAYLDVLLDDFARTEKDEVLVVVTQPGRLSSTAFGMIAVKGSIAAAGANLDVRSVDVAPTILHVLGIPVSRELSGVPIARLLSASVMERFPVREVPSYGVRPARHSPGGGDPLDAEALERLRSLGYVR
jgi:hypothetical protein